MDDVSRWQLVKKTVGLLFVVNAFIVLFSPGLNGQTYVVQAAKSEEVQSLGDIRGHWSETIISRWFESGFINAYPDQLFRPDAQISRGEFIAFINRAFGFVEQSDISFHDLERTDWEYNEVAKAVHAGYIFGYEDGTIRATESINRQEAAAVIVRLLDLKHDEWMKETVNVFTDADQISLWSKETIAIIVNSGMMHGYEDRSFRPFKSLTRAEALVTLDRASGSVIGCTHFGSAGVYGPISGERLITEDLTVSASEIKLQNVIIAGDLRITNDNDGEITLQNVTVRGQIIIEGSGQSHIYLIDSTTERINVLTPNKVLHLERSKLKEMNIYKQAEHTQIETSKNVVIHQLKLEASVTVTGDGEIELAILTDEAADSTFTREPNKKEGVGASTSNGHESYPYITSPPSPSPTPPPVINDSLTLVANGESEAIIIVADDAAQTIVVAAQALAEYMEKSTGVLIPIVTESDLVDDGNQIAIYIDTGHTLMDITISTQLATMDKDGFIIHPTADNQIFVVGPTEWGTINGVYDFLERFVGVRWLLPGPDGEDVPEQDTIVIPVEMIKEEPVFTFRTLSPARGEPSQVASTQLLNEWAQRNKLQGSYNEPYKFMHNLYRVFDPTEFGESHPEFYPERIVPAADDKSSWQPCLTNEDTIDVAANKIIQFFQDNPTATSFSLGVNDSVNTYCESTPSHPDYPNAWNSFGFVNMSDIYFAWINQVAAQVEEVYPDKWIGVLAYQNVAAPPSFSLHPQVIPFITKDRMTWMDAGVREHDQQIFEEWKRVASQVAWYDYLYGTYYTLPRVYPHQMAENYQYAAANQVHGTYAEMYHNLGDGPKAWLYARLQWNPNQHVDELLDEWYERMVGPAAAMYLAEYYTLWENFWIEKVQSSPWFANGKNKTYLPFTDVAYMDLVTEDELSESRRLMELVVDRADTVQQQVRANLLMQTFEYYEASALSYVTPDSLPVDMTKALAVLMDIEANLDKRIQMGQKRAQLMEAFADNEALRLFALPTVNWSGWNASEFWKIVDYLTTLEPRGGTVLDKIKTIEDQSDSDNLVKFSELIKEAYIGLFPLNKNVSFEEGTDDAQFWGKWTTTNTSSISRSEEVARTGEASLLIDSMQRGGPHQTLPFSGGLLTAQLYYYTPPETAEGWIQLSVRPKNAQGQNLANYVTNRQRFEDSADQWNSIEILEDIPETINGEDVTKVQVIAIIHGAKNVQVYIDDFKIYKRNETLVNPDTFWTLVHSIRDHEQQNGQLLDEIFQLANASTDTEARQYARLLLEVLDGNISFIQNPSFEEGDSKASFWGNYITNNTGSIERTETKARTGNASLLIEGMQHGGPHQTIELPAGLVAAQFYYYYDQLRTTAQWTEFKITLKDAQDRNLVTYISPRHRFDHGEKQWNSVEWVGEIPEYVEDKQVAKVTIQILIRGLETDVYIDDFQLYHIGISEGQ